MNNCRTNTHITCRRVCARQPSWPRVLVLIILTNLFSPPATPSQPCVSGHTRPTAKRNSRPTTTQGESTRRSDPRLTRPKTRVVVPRRHERDDAEIHPSLSPQTLTRKTLMKNRNQGDDSPCNSTRRSSPRHQHSEPSLTPLSYHGRGK